MILTNGQFSDYNDVQCCMSHHHYLFFSNKFHHPNGNSRTMKQLPFLSQLPLERLRGAPNPSLHVQERDFVVADQNQSFWTQSCTERPVGLLVALFPEP